MIQKVDTWLTQLQVLCEQLSILAQRIARLEQARSSAQPSPPDHEGSMLALSDQQLDVV